MEKWTFWEWVAYAILFIGAVILAADTGLRQSPEIMKMIPTFISSVAWGFAPLVTVLLATGILLANGLGWIGRHPNATNGSVAHTVPDQKFIKTALKLQFFGDYRTPIEVSSSNIASWYAYYSPSMRMTMHDADGKEVGGHEIPPSWAIFMALDLPSTFRQGVISFSNPEKISPMEVRFSGSRAIVSTVAGQVPAGILEVYAQE